jgi:hypothetical protein
MLYPQVAHETSAKFSNEFGFDFKFLKALRKREWVTDENRINRLESVLSFIREYGNVGTIDEPDEYIEDTQSMWFGPRDDVAFFSGTTDRTTYGLCGSAKHLVGQDPNKCPWPARSALVGVYNLLSEEVSPDDRNALGAVVTMASLAAVMKRPQQRLEFLGKRLAFDPHFEHNGKSTQLLLASPLYVAMTS